MNRTIAGKAVVVTTRESRIVSWPHIGGNQVDGCIGDGLKCLNGIGSELEG
jgi:hypothetical protein